VDIFIAPTAFSSLFSGYNVKRSGLKPETLMKSPYAKLKSLPFYAGRKKILLKKEEQT
jgi:hypothetical protein